MKRTLYLVIPFLFQRKWFYGYNTHDSDRQNFRSVSVTLGIGGERRNYESKPSAQNCNFKKRVKPFPHQTWLVVRSSQTNNSLDV